ncbi:2-polyprenyl-6-methoxyphenol hydroxylase [Geodermatophilus pulveris]|uniref:2-polyprenyl-6-methoxyphenol hydroxylase n=1 Tax=Geodermatophilus pulveris TaxID=1564159 RepID=A0A239DH99_9ACTN|nr:FAD-dependent oxidoreductase [Geodermatophilus pulveris]SNS31865.1 2-polyprenyl-6-methoxyphenol hydroxylase [Geodermatophilus pulveris]
MTDAPAVGAARTGHAVVVGAGMAGLLAAGVLAGHVDRVTVVERDRLPDGAQPRRGVPQGWQVHALLARGLVGLERLFPGFGRDLQGAGAVPVRLPGDVLVLGRAGWIDRRAPGWLSLSASRPLIEATVRRRLLELPGVTVVDGCEVTALRASDDGRGVRGVVVRGDDGPVPIEADLVVDASGRGTRTPTWLAGLGGPVPDRTTVDARITYASRFYRVPDGFAADWRGLILFGDQVDNPRTGYLYPVEGGRWVVGLIGARGVHAATDDAGFTAYARRLRSPVLAEAIAAAEPLSDVHLHRGTSNQRWHYERLRRWPERLVVLGDAACAFDPVYGQGMSSAVVAAELLDASLRARRPRGDLRGLGSRFQRRLARRLAEPWLFAVGEDLRFPGTTGGTAGPLRRTLQWYQDRLEVAATYDPVVTDVYVRALGMLERPTALLRPHLVRAAARSRPSRGDVVPGPVPRG